MTTIKSRVGIRQCLGLIALALACSNFVRAEENPWSIDAMLGLRFNSGDTRQSWLNGGLGKFRFDESSESAPVFENLALGLSYKPSLTTSAHVELFYHDDPDGRIALTQAFWQYKPLTSSRWRSRYRAGIFHAPFSLENRGKLWISTYTSRPSVINSWLGEELRTIGLEGIWTWRPSSHSANKYSVIAAVFGFNDPAASMLSWRGWANHNRQTGVGETLPLRWIPAFADGQSFQRQAQEFEPFKEVDNRMGGYLGLEWRRNRSLRIQAVYYDNNGDPKEIEEGQYAWHTRFTQLALHWRFGHHWEILSQWMWGNTVMGDFGVDNDFDAAYVMLAKTLQKKHRFALRSERFGVDDKDNLGVLDLNDEKGWAATAAYTFMPTNKLSLSLDYSHNDWSRASARPTRISWDESQLSLALRYLF
ncbi:MAG: hypothetical protein AB8B48_12015 [Pseudomonadales bacterium]